MGMFSNDDTPTWSDVYDADKQAEKKYKEKIEKLEEKLNAVMGLIADADSMACFIEENHGRILVTERVFETLAKLRS